MRKCTRYRFSGLVPSTRLLLWVKVGHSIGTESEAAMDSGYSISCRLSEWYHGCSKEKMNIANCYSYCCCLYACCRQCIKLDLHRWNPMSVCRVHIWMKDNIHRTKGSTMWPWLCQWYVSYIDCNSLLNERLRRIFFCFRPQRMNVKVIIILCIKIKEIITLWNDISSYILLCFRFYK